MQRLEEVWVSEIVGLERDSNGAGVEYLTGHA